MSYNTYVVLLVMCCCRPVLVSSLVAGGIHCSNHVALKNSFVNGPKSGHISPLFASTPDSGEEISSQLARAKGILANAKAKLAKQEKATAESGGEDALPFFAVSANSKHTTDGGSSDNDKRSKVVKSMDSQTGLITTDGELMASLSEQEPWEVRSLQDVFENEVEEDTSASAKLAERDVAASIFNLRKSMQMEDYRKIFDKRNRFIGEDN